MNLYLKLVTNLYKEFMILYSYFQSIDNKEGPSIVVKDYVAIGITALL